MSADPADLLDDTPRAEAVALAYSAGEAAPRVVARWST